MKELLSFVGGAAAGAALVALFTTSKGEDIRGQIKQILVKYGVVQEENADELVDALAEEIEG